MVWSPYALNVIQISKNKNIYNLEESHDVLSEKIHAKFCKFLIGANKYSSNIASKSETGSYPLAIIAILNAVKYWLQMNEEQNINKFSFQSLQNIDGTDTIYAENIKTQLKLLNFDMYGKINTLSRLLDSH